MAASAGGLGGMRVLVVLRMLLENLGKELDFSVERIEAMEDHEVVISSTKIRNAISSNQIELANEMLGYNYMVQGTVVKGDGRGKGLGFPTANIIPPNFYKLIPSNGVYIVSSSIDGKISNSEQNY